MRTRTAVRVVAAVLSAALLPALSASAEQYVRCESQDYHHRYCRAETDNRAELVRQFSKTRCVLGQSWGYDRRGVWVDRGCAAEFRVGRGVGAATTTPIGAMPGARSDPEKRSPPGLRSRASSWRRALPRTGTASGTRCRRGPWGRSRVSTRPRTPTSNRPSTPAGRSTASSGATASPAISPATARSGPAALPGRAFRQWVPRHRRERLEPPGELPAFRWILSCDRANTGEPS